jgi:uncharacterized protein
MKFSLPLLLWAGPGETRNAQTAYSIYKGEDSMTPQEAQMLQDLVRKVGGTQLTEKDPDAEALLSDGLARDPDALYKLAQTVLIQNIALDQARAQMQRMQQQLAPPAQQPARATSFLGGLFHHGTAQSAPPSAPQSQYAPPPPPPQYQAAPPNYPPPPAYAAPSATGGFLRSAAATAAGVAGGMLAFEGIESLMHGGLGGGWGGPGMAPQETVINNYYDNPQQASDPNWQGGPDEQPQGPYDDASNTGGPDEQPQGPYDASSDMGGPDEQPQGPYDDNASDTGDAQDYADDSGGDFDDGGGFDQV